MASQDEEKLLQRVTANPAIFGGKPIIRGERMSVQNLLELLAAGQGIEEVLADYPWLEKEDIQASILYASRALGDERFAPVMLDDAS